MRIEYKKVQLNLAAGQTLVEKTLRLPEGVSRAMVALKPGAAPDEFVELGVSSNGQEVVEPMDYRLSEKTTHGVFLDSWRAVSFPCGRDVQVQISTAAALANDFKIQVAFAIILKD